MEPIFSQKKEKPEQQKKEVPNPVQVPSNPTKPAVKRITRSYNTPSIKDALSGKLEDNTVSAKQQHQAYNNSNLKEDFNKEQFKTKWNEFLTTVDSPTLKTTLSNVPDFVSDYQFVLKIGNTVQEENIKMIKPKLVAFLRNELKNSSIEVITQIETVESNRIIYSDDEKYDDMVKKNSDLQLLRQKFNLDFGD
ncbi:MAG: hypothetical protein JXR31_01670 [Prolixibacteraceae bacterium]|nr:hypothetical protein [Prolixibacteraceae bacterium]MBN2772927.1 hypothetical protein [Prolixibacteraceae bacterium]